MEHCGLSCTVGVVYIIKKWDKQETDNYIL